MNMAFGQWHMTYPHPPVAARQGHVRPYCHSFASHLLGIRALALLGSTPSVSAAMTKSNCHCGSVARPTGLLGIGGYEHSDARSPDTTGNSRQSTGTEEDDA